MQLAAEHARDDLLVYRGRQSAQPGDARVGDHDRRCAARDGALEGVQRTGLERAPRQGRSRPVVGVAGRAAEPGEVLDDRDDAGGSQAGGERVAVAGDDRDRAAEGAVAVRVLCPGLHVAPVDVEHRCEVHVHARGQQLAADAVRHGRDLGGGHGLGHRASPREGAHEVVEPHHPAAFLVGHDEDP